MAKSFSYILKDSKTPETLQTDAGKEFFNKFSIIDEETWYLSFCYNLEAYVIERFLTRRWTRMWRYFMARSTRQYVDVSQDLFDGYNKFPHSY